VPLVVFHHRIGIELRASSGAGIRRARRVHNDGQGLQHIAAESQVARLVIMRRFFFSSCCCSLPVSSAAAGATGESPNTALEYVNGEDKGEDQAD